MIIEGSLGLQKKKGVEPRYFVLYEDRLDYFKTKEDAEASPNEPRGVLKTMDIQSMEASEGGFILNVLGQQSSLVALEEGSREAWIDAIQKVLLSAKKKKGASPRLSNVTFDEKPEVRTISKEPYDGHSHDPPAVGTEICSGGLQVDRKGKLVDRFFVLYPDKLTYHESEEDFKARKDARGSVLLTEVQRFEELPHGFSVNLRNEKRPFQTSTSSTEELARWLSAWEKLLKKRLGQDFVRLPTAKSDIVLEGVLSVVKKEKSEARYCVLCRDHFKYFIDESEFQSGGNPRCRISLDTVKSVEVASGLMLELTLLDRRIHLKADGQEELSKWQAAWSGALKSLSAKAQTTAPASGQALAEGQFEVTVGAGKGQVQKCFLFAEQVALQSGRIPTSSIEDLEVGDDGFTIHVDGLAYAMKPLGNTNLQLWLDAFDAIFSGTVAPAPVQSPATPVQRQMEIPSSVQSSVHEGLIEQGWGPVRQMRYAILHEDRLELFQQSDVQNGLPPSLCIWLSNIVHLKVLDSGFQVSMRPEGAGKGETSEKTVLGLRPQSRKDFNEWVMAWGKVFSRDLKLADGTGWSRMQSKEAETNPKQLLHRGKLQLSKGKHVEVKYFLVYADRLEYYADETSATSGGKLAGRVLASDIQEVRVLDHGFVLGLGGSSLDIRMLPGDDMEQWVNALKVAFSPESGNEQPEPLLSPDSPNKASASIPTDILAECETYNFKEWLKNLKEKPVMTGFLGFQHQGKLVNLYSVLFKERLDSWLRPTDAAAPNLPPASRIVVSDIHGVETIISGFILNCGGRKVGVHVSSSGDLQKWSNALYELIHSRTPKRSASAPPKATPTEAPVKKHKVRKPQDWVPRVATVSTVSRKSSSDLTHDNNRRISLFGKRAQQKIGVFVVNTHADGRQAACLLHGQQSMLLKYSNKPGGEHWVRSEVAENINGAERVLPRSKSEELYSYTEKVNVLNRSPMTPRVKKECDWQKVGCNAEESQSRPVPSRPVKELTEKVNAGRSPKKVSRLAGPLIGKITDSGRHDLPLRTIANELPCAGKIGEETRLQTSGWGTGVSRQASSLEKFSGMGWPATK